MVSRGKRPRQGERGRAIRTWLDDRHSPRLQRKRSSGRRRRLPFDLRDPRVEACPARRTCRPHRQRRPRHVGIIERPDSYKYQVRSCLGFAAEWRTARPAESPSHTVSAVRDTEEVGGFPDSGEGRGTEARVHGAATCTQILAVAAPAHASHYGQLRARPVNRTAEASTGYRHRVLRAARRSRMIAGRFAASNFERSGQQRAADA